MRRGRPPPSLFPGPAPQIMNVVLYEDGGWPRLLPLVYTRAVFQLRCGIGRPAVPCPGTAAGAAGSGSLPFGCRPRLAGPREGTDRPARKRGGRPDQPCGSTAAPCGPPCPNAKKAESPGSARRRGVSPASLPMPGSPALSQRKTCGRTLRSHGCSRGLPRRDVGGGCASCSHGRGKSSGPTPTP